jgi:hypothetical protein
MRKTMITAIAITRRTAEDDDREPPGRLAEEKEERANRHTDTLS